MKRLYTPPLFPFTHEGRQTLVYLMFAGAGPALTGLVVGIMYVCLEYKLFETFKSMAWFMAVSALILNIAIGMFVSIRAVKISKDGISAEGQNNGASI